MTIHPEIAKVLATLPAPAGSPLDPVAMRAGEAAQVPAVAERLPLHSVEDADRSDAVGRGAGADLHAGRGRRLRAARVPPRRRVLPRQPGHARPRRAVAGQGDRAQGHLRRLPPGARGRFPGRPRGLLRRGPLGRRAAATSLGWDGKNLAIAGDSSGGNFVAAVAAMAHDDGFDRHHAPGPLLPVPGPGLRRRPLRLAAGERRRATASRRRACKPFNAFYLESGADPADPLVSPIKREDLAGLPPALIITAEHDPLRDEGELYGQRLRGGRRRGDRQPLRGRQPRLRPALLLDPGVLPGLRGDRRLPERGGRAMTGPVAVHPLVSPWGRFGLYSFFIDAPEPAIVDTGIASSPAEGMVPALEAIGRRIEDVRWILLTHGHIDHVGGAHALWELTGRRAQVVIHEADAPLLRSRRAHVDEYLDGREQYLDDPECRRGADEGRERRHLRRDGADHAGQGRRDARPSAGTSPSRSTPSPATRPGPSPTSSTGSRRLRRRRRAGPRSGQRLPRLRGSGRLPLKPAVPARRGPPATPVPGPPVPGR